MVGRYATINLLAPANIIATTIVPSSTECIEPCTIDITVTWNNTGDIPGSFTPGIIVDNGDPIELTPESLDGGQTTLHTFTTPALMAGSHTICVNSGTPCQIITVRAPNIVATAIVPSTTTCTEPCDLTVDVTWLNAGDADEEFTPSIRIDNNPIVPPQFTSETLAAGDEITHTFTVPGLMLGSHTICAGPDNGTCTTITVRAPNIVATTIVPSTTTCTEPCDLTIDVTWLNAGDADGEFTPSIRIDNNPIVPPQFTSETLAAGHEITHTFTVPGLMLGSHTICTGPDNGICTTITVEGIATAGFSPLGKIIIAGIAVGAIYSAMMKPK